MNDAVFVVPGSHLFPVEHFRAFRRVPVFMAEDLGLCTTVRHHKQKIVLFLSAMRSHRDVLERDGMDVEYHRLDGPGGELSYEDRLARTIRARKVRELISFEVEDRSFDERLTALCRELGVERRVLPSPMFLTRPGDLASRLAIRPRMADFYVWQRRRLNILVESDGKPTGGRWSFDTENRKRLPAGLPVPPPPRSPRTDHTRDVQRLVEAKFGSHPGVVAGFDWPTTRSDALRRLDEFIKERLALFGPYEDAISRREPVGFHSQISPLLNCGLLTPAEVVARVLAAKGLVPIESLEGFVRQVIGWREFIRGIDLVHGEAQAMGNAWGHDRLLGPCWWEGGTGVPPLDDAIRAARETGWTHHIVRLMVAGNLMTLCGVRPSEAYRWFMEMFIDSAEWVMGPNVFGMGICSDGGLFATKPYLCGSNYILKMSDYPRGRWCEAVDGLYWGFIRRHRERLAPNPRMAAIVRSLDRLDGARLERILGAGEELRSHLTRPASV